MAPSTRIPKSLYKYRAFSALTVESLVFDKVFFADPSTFNDPLDTKPVVTAAGMAIDLLEKTVADLLQRRLRDEMLAAARSISYRGPKTTEHIDRLGEKYVRRELADIAYHATNPDYEAPLDESHRALLAHRLQIELLKRYDRGILSLAERNSCPLMWSHYGDQHRGLCIGYGVPQPLPAGLYPVHYGRSRLVDASLVAKMLDDDPVARSHVDAAVFLGKARDWRYEREWRWIGQRGLVDSPLELHDITFGIRCSDAVKATIVRALKGRSRPVMFYEMREVHGTFRLQRIRLDEDELFVSYPRRARDIDDMLEPWAVESSPANSG